ncbi:hypothetical protein [Nocardioides sp. 1609]|uniref:hypothetical protein n=1 Tax=Nocardioides sp. 1609 TaxID=2508327 RepID=UPI00106FB22D|nr:hypothetical protein [Nocardioides sp. 1609]
MPSHVDGNDVDQRIVEASAVVPWCGAVTGWAALRWCGALWFDGDDASGTRLPVDLCVSTHDIRPQSGIAVSGEGLDPRLVRWVDGVPVTDPRFASSFVMRYQATRRRAMVDLEKAMFHDLVSREEMAVFLAGQRGWTGIQQARDALAGSDENSWSPQEGAMRDIWVVQAEKPRPTCNRPLFDLEGHHIATPDLLDPVHGVFGDYDGELHLGRAQRDTDLRREGLLRHHDLEGVVMTAPDTRAPDAFIARLDDAYRRAARHSVADRTWTVEQPGWWTPTDTVARRRALSEDQRLRLLRHRRG